MLNTIFNLILSMSVTGILLWLFIIVLLPFTKKAFSAKWQYYSILIIIMFFIFPFGIIGNKINFPKIDIPTKVETNIEINNISNDLSNENKQLSNTYTRNYNIFVLLPYIWIAGAFIFSISKLIHFIKLKKILKKSSVMIQDDLLIETLNKCKSDMNIKYPIELLSNTIIRTPILTGLFKIQIFVPNIDFDYGELCLIFKHELTHFKQKDLWFKFLILIANVIHWFNPIIYLISKEFDNLCELSCDEIVVSDMNLTQRQFYGETILNILGRTINKNNDIYTAMAKNKKGIERRLISIMKLQKKSKPILIISSILTIALCFTGFTANTLVYGINKPKNNIVPIINKTNEDEDIIKNKFGLGVDGELQCGFRYYKAGESIKIKLLHHYQGNKINNGVIDTTMPEKKDANVTVKLINDDHDILQKLDISLNNSEKTINIDKDGNYNIIINNPNNTPSVYEWSTKKYDVNSQEYKDSEIDDENILKDSKNKNSFVSKYEKFGLTENDEGLKYKGEKVSLFIELLKEGYVDKSSNSFDKYIQNGDDGINIQALRDANGNVTKIVEIPKDIADTLMSKVNKINEQQRLKDEQQRIKDEQQRLKDEQQRLKDEQQRIKDDKTNEQQRLKDEQQRIKDEQQRIKDEAQRRIDEAQKRIDEVQRIIDEQ